MRNRMQRVGGGWASCWRTPLWSASRSASALAESAAANGGTERVAWRAARLALTVNASEHELVTQRSRECFVALDWQHVASGSEGAQRDGGGV